MLINEKLKLEFEEKLKSLGFKTEDNFTILMRKPTFLKTFTFGSLAQKPFLVAINSSQVILLELTLFSKISEKKEAIIFNRKDLDITFKKGILVHKITIKEKENPKNIFVFMFQKTFISIWTREHLKNIYKEITGLEY